MPYVRPEYRDKFNDKLNDKQLQLNSKGELEYCIFKLMINYRNSHVADYSNLHDCTYAAMHCADEFRRRFLDKREDIARDINGDIE